MKDVLIVGAGPAGLACAIELQALGLDTVIVEKGCVASTLTNFPTYMRFFTSADGLELGNIPMVCPEERPGRTEAVKYYQRLTRCFDLSVSQYETVLHVERHGSSFTVVTSRRRMQARKVILATGFFDEPVPLNVPGEHLAKVLHYYREPHGYFDQRVSVVGGRNSAGAAALELHRAGARVTLVHRRPALTTSMKPWIRFELEPLLHSGAIESYFDSHVKEINSNHILLTTPSGEQAIENDFVFALTGYRPNVQFLTQCGVNVDETTGRPDLDERTLETATPGLYLAGVIVSGLNTNELNISHARDHAKQIASHLGAVHRAQVA